MASCLAKLLCVFVLSLFLHYATAQWDFDDGQAEMSQFWRPARSQMARFGMPWSHRVRPNAPAGPVIITTEKPKEAKPDYATELSDKIWHPPDEI
ncbi:unnamed protein product [Bursaphelenchus okinawaensis]|uniref:Uncharacterized protein n=1 Tax=Bursaphelenchus okinawaensis TaxID=465554 RepID=A0A811LL38_9BILA|nr:unnamed protein product [Bursaphelenchus okinawaensis]CAG9123455.1 unnamed protein product [Bursaphelenchus okinawaensis]